MVKKVVNAIVCAKTTCLLNGFAHPSAHKNIRRQTCWSDINKHILIQKNFVQRRMDSGVCGAPPNIPTFNMFIISVQCLPQTFCPYLGITLIGVYLYPFGRDLVVLKEPPHTQQRCIENCAVFCARVDTAFSLCSLSSLPAVFDLFSNLVKQIFICTGPHESLSLCTRPLD